MSNPNTPSQPNQPKVIAPSQPASAPVTPVEAPVAAPVAAAPVAANAQPTISVDMLAAAFAQALGISNSQLANALEGLKPKAKITVANRVARNPMNPTNRKRKFPYAFYQNFTEIFVDDVLDMEFDLLLKLKPGSFVAGPTGEALIEVIEVKRGAQRGMHIRYNNKTQDQRIEFMVAAGSTLVQILTKCINEYESQKIERRAQRRREEEE